MDKLIEMFEESGKFIKKLAVFCFFVGIAASLILAIVFGKTPQGRYDEMSFNFFAFLGILIGSLLVNLVSSIFLYAFGDLVDNVKSIANNRSANQDDSDEGNILNSAIKENNNVNYSDSWVCKKCGTRNPKSRLSCKDCGEYK